MRLALASLMLLAACCSPPSPDVPNLSKAAESMVSVKVTSYGGFGSGFVVAVKEMDGKFGTLVLTAKHVTENSEEGFPTINGCKGTVVAEHPTLDAALVFVTLDESLPAMTIRHESLSMGEDIYSLGFSGDDGQLWVTSGVASDYNRGGFAAPGDSGGAVIDSQGRVVGVIRCIDSLSNGRETFLVYHHLEFVAMVDLEEWLITVLP